MRALLDVNVLVALFDPDHAFHDRAHAWFEREGNSGWASCPITENGLVRVLSHAEYSQNLHLVPSEVIASLEAFRRGSRHEFWPDSLSIRDSTMFLIDRIHGPRQLTDVYLLGLATHHAGRFVTFDSSIPRSAVRQANKTNLLVL